MNFESSNGSKINISLRVVSALGTLAALFLWAAGFVMGYMVYTRNMADLIAQGVATSVHIGAIEGRLGVVESAVVELKGDMKYTRQDISELKLFVLPKR